MSFLHSSVSILLDNIFLRQHQCALCENTLEASIENTQILAEMLPSAFVGRGSPLIGIDINGLVEVKDIQTSSLLAQFTEKRVFVLPCLIPNFSRYFSLHSGIPLTIFTIISLNISSSALDHDVSRGKRLLFCVAILSTILSILSATRIIVLFFSFDWHFSKYWERYFSFSRTLHGFHLRLF